MILKNITAFYSHINVFQKVIHKFLPIYAFVLILAILSAVISVCIPFILGGLIDKISAPNNTTPTSSTEAIKLLFILFSMYILSSIAQAGSNYLAASNSEKISHELRGYLARSIFHQHADHSKVSKFDNGHILSLFNRDIEVLWDFFGFALVDFIVSIVTICALCLVVLSLEFYIGFVFLLISFFFVFAFYINGKRIRAFFAEASPKFDKMVGFVSHLLSGYETVASFRRQSWGVSYIDKHSASVVLFANRAHRRSTLFTLLTSTMNIIAMMAVWLICLPSLTGKSEGVVSITLGEFIAVLYYFNMISLPLENISNGARIFSKTAVSVERLSLFINSMKNTRASKDESNRQTQWPAPLLSVCINGNYEPESRTSDYSVLKNINFDVKSGMIIGLAGTSGSGKSTLLRVLSRLKIICGAEVFLNGQPYQNISEDNFRKQVLYIPQKPEMFPVGFFENFFIDGSEIDFQKILDDISLLELQKRISEADDITMENLSGGEAQRIGVARSTLHSANLFLIDEPTSSLDLSNRKRVSECIQKLLVLNPKASIIIASHDEHILSDCSIVFVLDEGQIVNAGTHDELTQSDEIYQSIISSSKVDRPSHV